MTLEDTRTERHARYSLPLVRAVGRSNDSVEARCAAINHIAIPTLMGGVWALPVYTEDKTCHSTTPQR